MLLLLALCAAVLIFGAACNGGGAEKSTDGAGLNGQAATGAGGGGAGSDATGAGYNGENPDGGAGTDGGVYDDDPDDDDSGAGDDSYATSPAIAYPPEVQEQVDKFQEAALQLSLDDVASADELLRLYREFAFHDPVNDALFFAYEERMQDVCDGLNASCEDESPDDSTINNALENGFLFIPDDTYSDYFILRPDFLRDTFSETVSAKVQSYLNLLVKQYNNHYGHDFIENDTLMVTLDQLADMIIDWEAYIRLYQDALNRSDITANMDYYLKIYIGSIQIENSGLYTVAGMDENGVTLYKLMDEPRRSYLRFIENYPESVACTMIAELYQIYEDNDFLYSVKVEDLFRDYGLAYDL